MKLNDWLTILGALGGLEAIKWIVNFYVNRRTNARKENPSCSSRVRRNKTNKTLEFPRNVGAKVILLI